MKKKIIISLVLVIIFLVFGFFYWFKYIKPGTKIDLCDKFPEVPGEISCQEAGNIALAEYSGEVYGVEKTILYTEIEKWKEREVWLFRIKLKEIITNQEKFPKVEKVGTIEVVVDKHNKETLLIAYGPTLE